MSSHRESNNERRENTLLYAITGKQSDGQYQPQLLWPGKRDVNVSRITFIGLLSVKVRYKGIYVVFKNTSLTNMPCRLSRKNINWNQH